MIVSIFVRSEARAAAARLKGVEKAERKQREKEEAERVKREAEERRKKGRLLKAHTYELFYSWHMRPTQPP